MVSIHKKRLLEQCDRYDDKDRDRREEVAF